MKRTFKLSVLFLVITVITSCFAGTKIFAENSNLNYDYHIQDGELIEYFGKDKNVVIPHGITKISAGAFFMCTDITHITIPEDVSEISSEAFTNCPNLSGITVNSKSKNYTSENGVLFTKDKKRIVACPSAFPYKSYVIPNSVTAIEAHAFYGCNKLQSITVPTSITDIGISAFRSCTSLTSAAIPAGVITIENEAFYGCTSLKSVSILNGVTHIENNVFQGCTSLKSVSIPGSVISIGDNAFADCAALSSVSISDGIASIGSCAFSNCRKLSSITFPKSLNIIGQDAFINTKWLDKYQDDFVIINDILLKYKGNSSKVTIPDGVRLLNDSAFQGNESITDVAIPDSVTEIGCNTFFGCVSLSNVSISDYVTTIGSDAFKNCTSLKVIAIPRNTAKIDTAFDKYTTIIGYRGSAAQDYAQNNGNNFQMADVSDAVSGLESSEYAASSEQEQSASATILATANAGAMGLSPFIVAVILMCVAMIAVCAALIVSKRKARNRPKTEPAPSITVPEQMTADNPPPLSEPILPAMLPTEIICGECGRSCLNEARFCPNCGHEIKTS